jgi:phage shock protein A
LPSEGEKEICELEEEMSQLKAKKEELRLELSKQMAKLAFTKAKENSSWVTIWSKHRKVATKVVRIEFLS